MLSRLMHYTFDRGGINKKVGGGRERQLNNQCFGNNAHAVDEYYKNLCKIIPILVHYSKKQKKKQEKEQNKRKA